MNNSPTVAEQNAGATILLTAPTDRQLPPAVRAVPFRLEVAIPLSGLKLRHLSRLTTGQIFTTDISAAEDVAVHTGGALVGWGELDNVDGSMALRLTRLT